MKIRWEQHHRLTNDSEVLSGGDSDVRQHVGDLTGQRLSFGVVTESDLQVTVRVCLLLLDSLPHVLPSEFTGWVACGRACERVLFAHYYCTVTSNDDVR